MLTGLFNRRHLDEQLATLVTASQRYGYDVGLLLLDVDHFKRVNDTYGHPAGDTVLCELARRIVSELRAGDVAGRWGGEEFLVILPHTDLEGTIHTGDRIRAAVAAQPFNMAGAVAHVTVSGGCAAGVSQTVESLVHTADVGLYEAKASGRNCV
jgi:diguanylate cyclase (GGDEF)-like protein